MGALDRFKERLEVARERRPLLDHAIRAVAHHGRVGAEQHAGAVTYFGFLSVFPLLALGFFVVGYVARVYPDAQDTLVEAIDNLLPGLLGGDEGEISIADIEGAAGAVGLIGLVGVLYAGLGWLSALRTALVGVFEEPASMQPDFLRGKLRDLTSLAVLGTTLLVSVAVSGVATRLSGRLLEEAGVGVGVNVVVQGIALALGVAIGTLLFFLMFRLLAKPPVPDRALWSGALLGAVAFELLKQLSGLLLTLTKSQPAFQAFGIALILLVWINYFSKVALFAASWAQTSPDTRAALAQRTAGSAAPDEPVEPVEPVEPADPNGASEPAIPAPERPATIDA